MINQPGGNPRLFEDTKMKLDKYTRQARREYKEIFGKTLILETCGRVTLAFVKTGYRRGKLAWSIHSKNDGKSHRKYGEYMALDRLFNTGGMPVEFFTENGEDIKDVLWDLANIIIIPDL